MNAGDGKDWYNQFSASNGTEGPQEFQDEVVDNGDGEPPLPEKGQGSTSTPGETFPGEKKELISGDAPQEVTDEVKQSQLMEGPVLKESFGALQEEVQSSNDVQEQTPKKDEANVDQTDTSNFTIRLGTSGTFYFPAPKPRIGTTSYVFEGYHLSASRPAAVKIFKQEVGDWSDIYTSELEIWLAVTKTREAENVNVILLYEYGSWIDASKNQNYFFTMELAKIDLKGRKNQLKDDENRQEKLMGFLRGVANALHFLHTRPEPYIHLDVKPSNVFIFDCASGEIAKLGDFGKSQKCGVSMVGVGTPDFMPPESIDSMDYDEEFTNTWRVDIFSFGVTCYITLSSSADPHPFEGPAGSTNTKQDNIFDPSFVPPPLNNNSTTDYMCANHLLWKMMAHTDNKRPHMEQVIHDPFFLTPEKKLELIKDVANSLTENPSDDDKSVCSKIDNAFRKDFHSTQQASSESAFNWIGVLGTETYNTLRDQSGGENAAEADDSIINLVKFICHIATYWKRLRWDTELVQRQFGEGRQRGNQSKMEWLYSEKKLASYFLEKFPGLVFCLYRTLLEEPDPCGSVAFLKQKYNWDYTPVPD